MILIKTSDKLPMLKKGERQEINERKLLELAKKVGIILKKEKNIYDENISSPRNTIGN